MYEAHFGLSGAPFSLNPDPAFFFGSRGHRNALSYLKFGVHQGEGFVVVTGEIGAGKTTLVRTLLSEVDRERIVAAQIVSTQLEAGDLLRSVALAFGIAPKTLSKAELIATIEAFLTLLVTENRRALLIVDEAQNLSREAVEELRMLSNFQLGNQALLQSFLVGQPELRVLLTSKPMEQFRQRVIASCHLGPMDGAETRGYIEHRLRQVGWRGNPAIDALAFDRVFQWTSGIPRRVNLLCNRLLLAAYLEGQSRIDAPAVDAIGEEMRREVGDAAVADTSAPAAARDAGRPGSAAAPDVAVADAPPVAAREMQLPAQVVPAKAPVAAGATPAPAAAGPLLLVAASAADDMKHAMLVQALKGHPGMPRCLRVRIGEPARFRLNDAFMARLGIAGDALELDVCEADSTQRLAQVLQHFAPVVDQHRPAAIVVIGGGDEALACSLVARRKGCRLVHIDAGARTDATGSDDGALVDRIADVLYAAGTAAYVDLLRQGIDAARVENAGSLLVDAVQAASRGARSLEAIQAALQSAGGTARGVDLRRPFGLVLIEDSLLRGDSASITELLSTLHGLARDVPLVWPMGAAVEARLVALRLQPLARHERLAIVEPLAFADQVTVLAAAQWVTTDSPDVHLQAATLRVRCLPVDARRAAAMAAATEGAKAADGGTGARIAAHLADWLSRSLAAVAR